MQSVFEKNTAEANTKMEKNMKDLHAQMAEMPEQMKQFTVGMRALYAQKAVGGDQKEVKEFRQIRDSTRKDAIVYRDSILPLSKIFMINLSEYCDYYQALDFDDWSDNLEEIIKEVRSHKDICVLLINLLEKLIVPIKKREDEARKLSPTFENLKKKYEEKAKQLEERGASSARIASYLSAFGLAVLGLGLTSGVGAVIAAFAGIGTTGVAILGKQASAENMAKACAFTEQARVNDLATLCISETLIPALKNFLAGLTTAAGVFSALETELTKLLRRGEMAGDDPKQLHYAMMKKQSENIQADCRAFLAVLPDVKTDLAAIPTENTDNNYVDQWLEGQLRNIKTEMFADFKSLYTRISTMVGEAAAAGGPEEN